MNLLFPSVACFFLHATHASHHFSSAPSRPILAFSVTFPVRSVRSFHEIAFQTEFFLRPVFAKTESCTEEGSMEAEGEPGGGSHAGRRANCRPA